MAKVGDTIKIIKMKGEPQYSGKIGTIEYIDDIGQLHGSWGGLAVQPENDLIEILKQENKMKEILMSIHHKWAELIYSGEKTLELRKTAPKALDGNGLKVYLYDTDLKSITGVIYVNFCHEITEITPKIVENSCVSLDEIEKYKAKGMGKLYGWEICGVDEYGPDWLYPEDLHIRRAPQSWQYVR